jgi:hypothetical protein
VTGGALAELERVAVFAQAARGLVPAWASRPMLPHEVAAGINFADIDDALTAAYTKSAGILEDYRWAAVDNLGGYLGDSTDPAFVAATVTKWATTPDAHLLAELAAAKSKLAAVLSELSHTSGAQMLQEAIGHGVAGLSDLALLPAGAFVSEANSAVTAMHYQLMQAGLKVSQGGVTAEDALLAVTNASPNAPRDLSQQAAHIAYGGGRAHQADAIGTPPAGIYASALLDKAGCGPCGANDGHRYGTLKEAYLDYPHAGPYKDCKGGMRCRCTLVMVWPEEGGPATSPAPPPKPTPLSRALDGGGGARTALRRDLQATLNDLHLTSRGKPVTLTVASVDAGRPGQVYAQVEFYSAGDSEIEIGSATRTFTRGADGALSVSHDLFSLDQAYQGQGLGSAFNRGMEPWYRKQGVSTITLHANLDVGGYAWAKAGYDFDPAFTGKGDVLGLLYKVRRQFDQMDTSALAAPDLRRFRDTMRGWLRGVTDDPASWPLPYDLAMFGWTEGAATWPGRRAMLRADWLGRKPV